MTVTAPMMPEDASLAAALDREGYAVIRRWLLSESRGALCAMAVPVAASLR